MRRTPSGTEDGAAPGRRGGPAPADGARAERLTQALRANLARRKAQARARRAGDAAVDAAGPEEPGGQG
jgi:hypothetical protein